MREKLCPECRWVVVVDAEGRRRLEMRWQPPVVPSPAVVLPPARVARAA